VVALQEQVKPTITRLKNLHESDFPHQISSANPQAPFPRVSTIRDFDRMRYLSYGTPMPALDTNSLLIHDIRLSFASRSGILSFCWPAPGFE
jgi:hypothetical protein